MLQFGASLADDTRVIIYDCNMFIVQATERQRQRKTSYDTDAGADASTMTPL